MSENTHIHTQVYFLIGSFVRFFESVPAFFVPDILQGAAFNVTHFECRITHLLYTAINTTEHG